MKPEETTIYIIKKHDMKKLLNAANCSCPGYIDAMAPVQESFPSIIKNVDKNDIRCFFDKEKAFNFIEKKMIESTPSDLVYYEIYSVCVIFCNGDIFYKRGCVLDEQTENKIKELCHI